MSIFDRMKQGASEAARKVEQTVEITKLKSQISGKVKEMDKLYHRIGQTVFHSFVEGDVSKSEGEVTAYCDQLLELEEEIAAINDRIKSLKLEKACAGCGKSVPINVRYCPDCGKKFPEEEAKPQSDDADEIRVICGRCHAENDFSARYCIGCGEELAPARPEQPM